MVTLWNQTFRFFGVSRTAPSPRLEITDLSSETSILKIDMFESNYNKKIHKKKCVRKCITSVFEKKSVDISKYPPSAHFCQKSGGGLLSPLYISFRILRIGFADPKTQGGGSYLVISTDLPKFHASRRFDMRISNCSEYMKSRQNHATCRLWKTLEPQICIRCL